MQETIEYFVALCMWRFMHVILLKIVDMGTIHAYVSEIILRLLCDNVHVVTIYLFKENGTKFVVEMVN